MSNTINIRLASSNHQITVPSRTYSIANVRKAIFKILPAFPPEKQRLFFRGKQLEDGYSLFDYDVSYLDTVQLFAKPVVQPDVLDDLVTGKENALDNDQKEDVKMDQKADVKMDQNADVKMDQKEDQNNDDKSIHLKDNQEGQDARLARELQNEPELCKQNDDSNIVVAGQGIDVEKLKKGKGMAAKQTKQWGGGVSCSKVPTTCTIVPPNHVGAIPGIPVGSSWKHRIECSGKGVHRPPVGGIAGSAKNGGYPEDVDNGLEFYYTGSGGRNLKEGNKRTGDQSFDQTLTKQNEAIAATCDCPIDAVNGGEARNWKKSRPIRVVRGFKLQKHHPKYAPEDGYRYDGLYKCVKYWPEKGASGFIVWRFLMRRDDEEPAPWFVPSLLRCESGKANIARMKLGIKETPVVLKRVIYDDDEDELFFAPRKKVEVLIKRKPVKFTPSPAVMELVANDSRKDDPESNYRPWTEVFETCFKTEADFIAKVQLVFTCAVCQDTVEKPLTTGISLS